MTSHKRPDPTVIGARLRAEREATPYWSRGKLARLLRDAADPRERDDLAHVPSLTDMIKQWENGKHLPGHRYRRLYSEVTGRTAEELFSPEPASPQSPWPTDQINGQFTLDDHQRLTAALNRRAKPDGKLITDLQTVLAAQRRLEDSLGPAALLVPAATQLNTITTLLKDATGTHRDALARVVSEWTCFVGWLHAAIRRDRAALDLFDRAEQIADEVADGTLAATATSFRGYIARRQDRHRAVVRAASAALATPGAHPTQRTYDTLQAAQGHAAIGETEQARRLLDQATHMAQTNTEPPPAVYWYSEPFFRLNIGIVQLGIGRYRDAADLIGSGLADMPPDQQHADWTTEYRTALTQAGQHT